MKAIPSAPGYFADENGDIWRGDCKLNTYVGKQGYVSVSLRNGAWSMSAQVHRLVCEAYHGLRPQGHQCRHVNGVRHDNQPHNLAWGTLQEQVEDKRRHGTLSRRKRDRRRRFKPRRHVQSVPLVQMNLKIPEATKTLLARLSESYQVTMTEVVVQQIERCASERGVSVPRKRIPDSYPEKSQENQTVTRFEASDFLIERAPISDDWIPCIY